MGKRSEQIIHQIRYIDRKKEKKKHLKRFSASLFIREMQIKPQCDTIARTCVKMGKTFLKRYYSQP